MNQMTASEFDKLTIKKKLESLPVEIISNDKTLFYVIQNTPEDRSAVNTFTEDQVVRMIAGSAADDHAAVEAARKRIEEFKASHRSHPVQQPAEAPAPQQVPADDPQIITAKKTSTKKKTTRKAASA